MSRCLIIIESQPPTIDQWLAVKKVITEYSKITLYLMDKPNVMPVEQMTGMWEMLLSEYPEVELALGHDDFTTIAELPEDFSDMDMVKVSDKEVYVHLATVGIPVEMLGTVKGYSAVFQRIAYRQGLALEYIKRFM